jgi:aspartyl/asparaginyl beta-hydroxylase
MTVGNRPAEASRPAVAAALWHDLRGRFGERGLDDVKHMLDMWSGARERRCDHPRQEYAELYLPGLPDEPWIAPERFAFHEQLVAALPALSAEAAQLIDGTIDPPRVNAGLAPDASDGADTTVTATGFQRPEGWREWLFYRLNRRRPEAIARLPKAGALADVVAATEWAIAINYQIMRPGVKLGRHVDISNFFVTYQAGVVIPPGCGLEVAGEARAWAPGDCVAFNNAYLHDAWNHGASTRVLFSAYVMYPGLNDLQRRALLHLASVFDFASFPELMNGGL